MRYNVRNMNENQTSAAKTVRPTKKQRELLGFIDTFIQEHGYSPSYREIMAGLNYTSVATVSLHVGNLIKRGHLRKRENSARSLEVVRSAGEVAVKTNQITESQENWLVDKVEHMVADAETAGAVAPAAIENISILVAALQILGSQEAAIGFTARIAALKKRTALDVAA